MPTLPNGRNVSADEYKRYWNQVFQNDPVLQQISAQVRTPEWRAQQEAATAALGPKGPGERGMIKYDLDARRRRAHADPGMSGQLLAAHERMKELGFDFQEDEDFYRTFGDQGYGLERKNWWERNSDWALPAIGMGAVAAAPLIAGAFGGAAAAAPTTSSLGASASVPAFSGGLTSLPAASAAIPAAGATIGPGVTFGAPAAAGTAATTASGGASSVMPAAASAAGGAGSFYGKALLGLGGDLLNGYFANRGANRAADELNKSAEAQIASYDKALGPYMDPGPLNILKGLAGIPVGGGAGAGTHGATAGTPVPGLGAGTTGRTAPPTAGPPAGFGVPRQGGTLASMAGNPQRQAQAQTASSFVRMVNQDGEEDDIPADRVQDAIRMFGARPVGAAMGRG